MAATKGGVARLTSLCSNNTVSARSTLALHCILACARHCTCKQAESRLCALRRQRPLCLFALRFLVLYNRIPSECASVFSPADRNLSLSKASANCSLYSHMFVDLNFWLIALFCSLPLSVCAYCFLLIFLVSTFGVFRAASRKSLHLLKLVLSHSFYEKISCSLIS